MIKKYTALILILTSFVQLNSFDMHSSIKAVIIGKNIIIDRPLGVTQLTDVCESYALDKAGYTKEQAVNKMTGERMFALSIAWCVCPPTIIIPIAYSIYELNSQQSNPKLKNMAESFAVKRVIKNTIKTIKK